MKKQFEIDWGKIIFSLKTRDPNWPVNRRGAGLSLKELALGQSEPKSVLVSIQARERMTKQGDPELLFRGGVLNRCAGSLFTLGVGGGVWPGPPRSQLGAVNAAAVSTRKNAEALDHTVCKSKINPVVRINAACFWMR